MEQTGNPKPESLGLTTINEVSHTERSQASETLGAEGTIGGKLLRFERILDLGHNQVVYALYCPTENFRMAYGFDRLIFEPTYIKPSSPDRIENEN